MEEFLDVLNFLLKSSGVIGLLTAAWIKYRSDKKLAAFKSELTRFEAEQNTRFSQVYSIRVTAIRELYKKLVNAEGSILSVLKPLHWGGEDPIELKIERATKDGNALNIYFTENEILFSDLTSELVKKIQDEFFARWGEYQSMQFLKDTLDGPERAKQAREQWDNFEKTFKETIPELKKKLQRELQKELGLNYAESEN